MQRTPDTLKNLCIATVSFDFGYYIKILDIPLTLKYTLINRHIKNCGEMSGDYWFIDDTYKFCRRCGELLRLSLHSYRTEYPIQKPIIFKFRCDLCKDPLFVWTSKPCCCFI